MQNSIVQNCTMRYCNKFKARGQSGGDGGGREGEAGEVASNQQPADSGQWEGSGGAATTMGRRRGRVGCQRGSDGRRLGFAVWFAESRTILCAMCHD